MPQAFLTSKAGVFAPGPDARGPWGERTLHGRILAGLVAREFEREFGDPAFRFARLTVDMFRMPSMEPISVAVEAVREGRRIRVLAGVLHSEGREVARASAVMLRHGDAPEGRVWSPEPWDAPAPDDVAPLPPRDEGFAPPWQMRPIGGPPFGTRNRSRAWLRDDRELVSGEPLSPFVRVALAADIASPLSNAGDRGLAYVNADLTLYLNRYPAGEWLGWEVTQHQSSNGIAVGGCAIHDELGAVGTSSVCAIANRHI